MKTEQNRLIRIFISSTFRDMMGERDELMKLCPTSPLTKFYVTVAR